MSRQTTTRRRHGVRRMSERKRLTITAITAVLALVTVVICALSGVFNFHKGNERILPNLVGQTEESAKAQLAELDAEPSITYENSDETKGIVIRQDVNEGTQLKHRQTGRVCRLARPEGAASGTGGHPGRDPKLRRSDA